MFKRKQKTKAAPTASASTSSSSKSKKISVQSANQISSQFSPDASSRNTAASSSPSSSPQATLPSSNHATAASFLASLNDPDVVEVVRTTIHHSHVFKLPPRNTGSIGWRGSEWKEKVWHGTCKIVDRNKQTAILLVDTTTGTIFAVCPILDGVNAVERCVDSSRYFVLRIENGNGRHMFIGLAFNERNDAFDFNTALQDAKKEREFDLMQEKMNNVELNGDNGDVKSNATGKDYSLKDGQTIKVNIPKKHTTQIHGAGGGTKAFANFMTQDVDDSNVSPPSKAAATSLPGFESSSSSASSGSSAAARRREKAKARGTSSGGAFLLKPSKKDTPARTYM